MCQYMRVGRQKGGLWQEGVGSKGLTLKQKNLLSKTLRGVPWVCSEDRLSCISKVFYLPSIEIISPPVTLPLGSGGVRVGKAICEIVLFVKFVLESHLICIQWNIFNFINQVFSAIEMILGMRLLVFMDTSIHGPRLDYLMVNRSTSAGSCVQ